MSATRLFVAACLLAAQPTLARAEAPPVAAEADQLTRIETYLNGITTAKADFTQANPDGGLASGVLTLSRPGKLRFEYTEPKGDLLIADGDYIIYWDAKLQQASNAPISSTPADFFLKPHISLTQGVTVTAYEHASGIIRVTVVQSKDPSAGSLTVAFADQPLTLKSWRVVDGQGQATEVALSNLQLGVSVDDSLFKFKPPNSGHRGR